MATQTQKPEIKSYCNRHMYSDVHPYEVLETLSPTKVKVREMGHKLTKAPSYVLGGFLAHTNNDEQEHEYFSDESNPVIVLHWSPAKKDWYERGGHRNFRMSDKPVYFYDYNF